MNASVAERTHWRCRALAWLCIRLHPLVYTPMSSADTHRFTWWEDLVLSLPDRMCERCETAILD